jgi:hypothetical protein
LKPELSRLCRVIFLPDFAFRGIQATGAIGAAQRPVIFPSDFASTPPRFALRRRAA